MRAKAELGFFPFGFAIQDARGIARALVRIIAPFLTPKDHASLEELLRRNAATTFLGIEVIEQRREFLEHRVDAALDGTKRMIRRYAGVEVDDRQEVRLSLRFAAHTSLTRSAHVCSNHSE